jgi:hypothetical protein
MVAGIIKEEDKIHMNMIIEEGGIMLEVADMKDTLKVGDSLLELAEGSLLKEEDSSLNFEVDSKPITGC